MWCAMASPPCGSFDKSLLWSNNGEDAGILPAMRHLVDNLPSEDLVRSNVGARLPFPLRPSGALYNAYPNPDLH